VSGNVFYWAVSYQRSGMSACWIFIYSLSFYGLSSDLRFQASDLVLSYSVTCMLIGDCLKRAGIENMPLRPKVLIFRFYFLRAVVASWQNIAF
ncbi:MAG TPA: hypothetical protein PL085_16430, partial [Agriterribacter sp.]|uniref:hypothetical protein n=1 Tax=Agriterribacter sp. TaxID=2821509 RepID=UPI002CEEF83D